VQPRSTTINGEVLRLAWGRKGPGSALGWRGARFGELGLFGLLDGGLAFRGVARYHGLGDVGGRGGALDGG
jgi:hypothetical protein